MLPLSLAVERHPELVGPPRLDRPADDPFVARNEAGWRGGAVRLRAARRRARGAGVADRRSRRDAGTALHWRTLIVLEEGAEAEVWEQYRSAHDDAEGLFNTVVELRRRPGRATCATSARRRSRSGRGCSRTQRAEVGRDARSTGSRSGFGSARGKVRMETKLAGQGASARVTGAYAGARRASTSTSTPPRSTPRPHTTSDLAFRGVLADRATAVWRGMIRVDPGAQQTDAFQESPQPAALQARPRRRDPRPGDRGRRRALHARRGDRPGRPRAALLPARPRPAARPTRSGWSSTASCRSSSSASPEGPVREAWPARWSAASRSCWAAFSARRLAN